jgi:hypothetical protein
MRTISDDKLFSGIISNPSELRIKPEPGEADLLAKLNHCLGKQAFETAHLFNKF